MQLMTFHIQYKKNVDLNGSLSIQTIMTHTASESKFIMKC